MRRLLSLLLACGVVASVASAQRTPRLLSVERIWSAAPHCAFTDLVRLGDTLYCTFREGERHVFGTDGRIRVIARGPSGPWRSVALLAEEGVDLRAPKLCVTPDGRLQLTCGGSLYDGHTLLERESRVAFLDPSTESFGPLTPVVIDAAIRTSTDWLWRVTWHEGVGYGVVYQPADDGPWGLQLVATRDGVRYEHVTALDVDGKPNETTLRVREDGALLALIRREGGDKTARLGIATPPYKEWRFAPLPERLGGPNLVSLGADGWLAAGRRYGEDETRTLLARVSEAGAWDPLFTLPSGGDTSYPGLVREEGRLLVSYYSSHEGKAAIYLATIALDDRPTLELHRVFETERFPCVTVALDGTVIATWGSSSVRARRSEDGGSSWSAPITIADPGFQGGGTLVDEETGDVLAFVESSHPPSRITLYRSTDHGKTWKAETPEIAPDSLGHVPSMHMNDSGITLHRGEHAGRLIRPTRFYAGANDKERWPEHYTNAIYSDDHGLNWQTSEPFPENGTGEATIAELSDGRLYYNSRVHWPEAQKNTRRRAAWSTDGGHTWEDWAVVDVLPDGRQDRSYGCMGGLVRLPIDGRDVLVFSNLDTEASRRERVTVWASFDGGETWPVKRLVFGGQSAYSSLTAGRPGTASQGWIYLQFEGGPGGGCHVARFNLAWLVEGEATGDGEVPAWAR